MRSYQLADFVSDGRERDLLAIRLAAHQRLRELQRLIARDLRRKWWLVRIDHRLDHHRSRRRERFLHNLPTLRGVLDPEAACAARFGQLHMRSEEHTSELQSHSFI